MADKQRLTHTHTHSNQRGFTMCSLEPNCSSGPCESAAKAISRCYSQSIQCVLLECVCVCVFGLLKMSVHVTSVYLCIFVCVCALFQACVLVLLCVCPYLLLICVRVPVALVFFFVFFSPTWLPSKPEELIGIRITFLKGRSFSAGAEC